MCIIGSWILLPWWKWYWDTNNIMVNLCNLMVSMTTFSFTSFSWFNVFCHEHKFTFSYNFFFMVQCLPPWTKTLVLENMFLTTFESLKFFVMVKTTVGHQQHLSPVNLCNLRVDVTTNYMLDHLEYSFLLCRYLTKPKPKLKESFTEKSRHHKPHKSNATQLIVTSLPMLLHKWFTTIFIYASKEY